MTLSNFCSGIFVLKLLLRERASSRSPEPSSSVRTQTGFDIQDRKLTRISTVGIDDERSEKLSATTVSAAKSPSKHLPNISPTFGKVVESTAVSINRLMMPGSVSSNKNSPPQRLHVA
ncbi:hypothetical protein CEXT_179161 [Caerostris extrusa]|uniref:Uncharacterized protein n=1 Tax=Caerostris extrusa TaxID=172846 RepID=A0AAV4QT45_CAEEX|nr:hypothetical protein CEXT_179161 [Caerostris extrusa]